MVSIKPDGNKFQLYRDSQPYRIRGAGYGRGMDRLAACGANSLRTWVPRRAQEILDQAHSLGLTVTMGLTIAHERHGFDYNDRAAVLAQLDRARTVIETFRDHPALLLWGIGNEYETLAVNDRVWEAVEEMAVLVHELDPHHPTMTVVAGARQPVLEKITRCLKNVAVIGINAYGDLAGVLRTIDAACLGRPYVITEWGPDGWWETPQTSWGAAFEPLSGEKYEMYASRFKLIESYSERCLGSYAFLWGPKQERTPTWFSLVDEAGHLTEAACALRDGWSGTPSAASVPHLKALTLDEKRAPCEVRCAAGKELLAQVEVAAPGGARLIYSWRVFQESAAKSIGGDWEPLPAELPGCVSPLEAGSALLTAPAAPGPYRLFVTVVDAQGTLASGNIPFYVEQ